MTLDRMDMRAYTLTQLWMVVSAAPDRRVLWTRFEWAAEAELERRLYAKDAA